MRLNEIEYLRPILFIQLFFTHAFTIYTFSSWPVPDGIEQIVLYEWIERISYSCMLELFTFISGFVYYYVASNREQTYGQLIISKFKRLMIPSIIFSVFYYIFLMNHQNVSWQLLYDILCGVGHLWYLPMLFLCFLIAYFIKDTISPFWILFLTIIVSSFSRCPNVFRVSQVAYYFFYFYLGLCCCRYRTKIHRFLFSDKIFSNILMPFLFVFSLIILLPVNYQLKSWQFKKWIDGYFLAALIRFINIIYSVIGIAFWYCVAVRLSVQFPVVPLVVKQFNVLSMGVYIFHQFILMFLYYHTKLPMICGSWILPWGAIIITFPLSILLSYIFKSSKLGKSLI